MANSKKISILDLQDRKRQRIPITMLTAYDFSSAELCDAAGIDILLVGDTLAMVMLGHEDTVSVTMEEMLHHCKAVARGANNAFLIGDMPFMSYQAEIPEAIRNAGRLLKEGRMDAVKLEGGREMAATIRAITLAGIPVMGHIGLTPQTISRLGGYRVQGKTATSANELLSDALALEEAGCFAMVLEAVPPLVAAAIREKVTIPVIGIGAGADCDGQVLVYHDILGLFKRFVPKFVKQYAQLSDIIGDAIEAYRDDVVGGTFPSAEYSYTMKSDEIEAFLHTQNGHTE